MQETKSSLSVVKDAYSDNSQAMFSNYVSTNFTLAFENLRVKFKDAETIIQEIKQIDDTITKIDFKISNFYDFYVLEGDNCLLTFDSHDNKKKISISYFFKSYKESKPIFDVIQKYQDKDDEEFINISNFYFDNSKNIKVNESKKVKEDFLNESELYYPYLDIQEMFRQFTASDSNILLLCGDPGCGKTRLGNMYLKYLLDNVTPERVEKLESFEEDGETFDIISKKVQGIQVAYIKNEEILSNDMFWTTLLEEEYNVVFLDDLDYGLLPRTQAISSGAELDKNKFISNLLSFTDGLFESGKKTKFIITTNRSTEDIDKAVLRKGRTFNILQLRELKNSEAKDLWVNEGLDVELFDSEFKTNNILQADIGSYINDIKKTNETNTVLKPYILEDNISLLNKVKKHKKIGL